MTTTTSRRWTLGLLASTALLPVLALAQTDAWPSKPIRTVVPFPAGGGTDIVARDVTQKISAATRWTFVIDNKPGSGGNLGIDSAAKAAPDGYSLVIGQTSNLAINPSLYAKLPYDPVKDLTAIAEVVTQPLLLVAHPSVPAKTFRELLDAAKLQPNPLSYTSGGPGSYGHLWFEMVAAQQKVQRQHIGYNGVAPALRDVMGGQVPVLIDALVPTGTQVKAGKVQGLAIVRSKRSPMLPEVPTLQEQGMNLPNAAPFYGVVGPAGLPPAVLQKLNDTLVRALKSPALQAKLTDMGFDVVASSPEEYGRKIRQEIELWSQIVRDNQIKVD